MMYLVIDANTDQAARLLLASNVLWKDVPEGGILRFALTSATVFISKKSAKAAIQRTRDYDRALGRKDHEFDWQPIKLHLEKTQ